MVRIKDFISTPANQQRAYFIAEIGFNHDGSLKRAKALVKLAAKAGADAAKFQHIKAAELGSRTGFDKFYGLADHQTQHRKHAMEAYKEAEIPLSWTEALRDECHAFGLDFITAPYYSSEIEYLAAYVDAFKVGSGDFAWIEKNRELISTGKPVLLACGASDLASVVEVMGSMNLHYDQICLMQCNSSYIGGDGNLPYLNLNTLKTFRGLWPDITLGLSDHTRALSVPVAARALGATVFERHFTDDNEREGADHRVALNVSEFSEMVETVRSIEDALGDGVKKIEQNEKVGSMTQRRALRISRDLESGQVLSREDISVLRPWMEGCFLASDLDSIIGMRLALDVSAGEEIRPHMLISNHPGG